MDQQQNEEGKQFWENKSSLEWHGSDKNQIIEDNFSFYFKVMLYFALHLQFRARGYGMSRGLDKRCKFS